MQWPISDVDGMSFPFRPWMIVLGALSEFVRREQEKVIAYLQVENQILREKLGGNRVLLRDDQRRRLAIKGKALGRQQLKKIATVAQDDTILRWHRELVEVNGYTQPRRNIGRPTKDKQMMDLVLRMARENTSWGYKRIEGALHNLGYAICSSTVANILKQHGIEPAPARKRTTSWSTFLKAHWDVFEGLNLAEITLRLSELVRDVLNPISHSSTIPSAAVEVSNNATPHPPTHTIRCRIFQRTVTQPARAPPIPAGVLASISPCEIRHAA
jgi:hypothetical protein